MSLSVLSQSRRMGPNANLRMMPWTLPVLLSSPEDLEVMRGVLDAVENPVIVKDHGQRFLLVNRAACALFGRSYEEIIGRTDHDLLPNEQADISVVEDRRVLETGLASENEQLLADAAGRPHLVFVRRSLLRRDDGQV